MEITMDKVDSILLDHNYDPASLISILQSVQKEAGYLPYPAMLRISERTGVSMAKMQSLGTFYRSFSLVPTGKHKVCVCMGTACHIRGGHQVLDKLERDLEVKAGETTADRKFTLETVRCLGCCSLAPVVKVDENIYGRVTQNKVPKILRDYT